MPLYEFKCQSCGRGFEALVRIGGEHEVCCAACGGRDVRKLVSAFGIGGGGASRLKSSGNGCATCSSSSCSTCK